MKKFFEVIYVVNTSTKSEPGHIININEYYKTVVVEAVDFTEALIKLSHAKIPQAQITDVKRRYMEVVK